MVAIFFVESLFFDFAGSERNALMVNFGIDVPKVQVILTSLVSVIPMQLLSYYIAVMRGRNVDQQRNLAKSVTVE